MKSLTLLFVMILTLPVYGQKAKTIKDFNVKSVFGVNLGDSIDSITELIADNIPKNTVEYRRELTKCGKLLGLVIESPVVYVQRGKVESLIATVLDFDSLATILEKDTKTVRTEYNGMDAITATYKNCEIVVMTNGQGYDYRLVIQKRKKTKK